MRYDTGVWPLGAVSLSLFKLTNLVRGCFGAEKVTGVCILWQVQMMSVTGQVGVTKLRRLPIIIIPAVNLSAHHSHTENARQVQMMSVTGRVGGADADPVTSAFSSEFGWSRPRTSAFCVVVS